MNETTDRIAPDTVVLAAEVANLRQQVYAMQHLLISHSDSLFRQISRLDASDHRQRRLWNRVKALEPRPAVPHAPMGHPICDGQPGPTDDTNRQIEIKIKDTLARAGKPLKISSLSRMMGKEKPSDYLRKAVYAMHRRGDISRDADNRYSLVELCPSGEKLSTERSSAQPGSPAVRERQEAMRRQAERDASRFDSNS